MPPMLQAIMSALTQSDHIFLGLPHAFELGTSILVTDLIQDEDRTTCPYHLRRLERRAAVTSCIPEYEDNIMIIKIFQKTVCRPFFLVFQV